jgi:tetratricopeptide (TPR) repeat protein
MKLAHMENEWGFDQELIACLSTPADAHLKDKKSLFVKRKKVERPKLDPIPLNRYISPTDDKARASKIKLANQDSGEDHFSKWKCRFCGKINLMTRKCFSCSRKMGRFPKEWIDLKPSTAAGLCSRGKSLAEMSMHDEALVNFGAWIKIDPISGTAYGWRAKSLSALGRNDEALEDLTKQIQLQVRECCCCCVRCCILTGTTAATARAFHTQPDGAGAYEQRAACYQEMKRHKEAVDDFTKMAKLEPQNCR